MILELQYVNTEADKMKGTPIHFFKGRVTGTPIGAEVCIDGGAVADRLAMFIDGDKDNPSPAFTAGVIPCIELFESHFVLAPTPRKYKDDDGAEHTSWLDKDKTIPIHRISKVRGADESKQGWTVLKSLPFRASPVKAPAITDTELATLLAG